jgi:predicted regulator of Ras-like GTPase activity (Roadblock/LC7/MglB family)
MANFDDILKEISTQVTGYIACALVDLDGLNLASNTISQGLNPEIISAQLSILFRLVKVSVEHMDVGEIEDNLTTTNDAYILMRFLPGKQYYLSIAANRKTANLGNMRLMSKIYSERLGKVMPSLAPAE